MPGLKQAHKPVSSQPPSSADIAMVTSRQTEPIGYRYHMGDSLGQLIHTITEGNEAHYQWSANTFPGCQKQLRDKPEKPRVTNLSPGLLLPPASTTLVQ